MKLNFRLLITLPLALTCLYGASPDHRPNIIVILSDDMGYSDLGCYGGEIATPNLDTLANKGLRFTQFYNNARCCPSRASLLTGLYSHQAGIGHMVDNRGTEAYRGELNQRSVTIAEALKPSGYQSYAVGKWHVTPGKTPESMTQKKNWPLQRGFDRFYGTINGSGSFWDPNSLVRDNREITIANDPEYQPSEYYYTDAISDQAVRFIRDHTRAHAAKPFFMYVAYTAAHWPMHARESDIAKYRGRYDAGYGPIAADRWAKQKQLGVVDPAWGLPPSAEDWSQVANQAFEARGMEVYAAMVEVMDQGIGRIVAELKARGLLENTLICYLQDNGGCAETNGRIGPFQPRAAKPSLSALDKDVAQYGNMPAQTRDGWPIRTGYGVMPGPADTYVAYGAGWANVSNTPFREYKHWVHEGGIATPLIVHWPAGLPPARQGRLEHQPSHLMDIMATCIDLAGAKYPAEFNGHGIPSMEGSSLRPALRGESLNRPQPIFWEHEGNRAVRDGAMKLVSRHPGDWELYDISKDRTERHNLAKTNPDRVQSMASQWDSWARRVGVEPWEKIKAAAPAATITPSTAKLIPTAP